MMKKKRILIIHGPNMNLLGLRLIKRKTTLDKLNKHLRKIAKKNGFEVKIVQTNEESRAVAFLQKERNRIQGVLLFPGPWQQSGHVLKDTLELLKAPFITISTGEKEKLLCGIKNIKEKNIFSASETAMKQIKNLK